MGHQHKQSDPRIVTCVCTLRDHIPQRHHSDCFNPSHFPSTHTTRDTKAPLPLLFYFCAAPPRVQTQCRLPLTWPTQRPCDVNPRLVRCWCHYPFMSHSVPSPSLFMSAASPLIRDPFGVSLYVGTNHVCLSERTVTNTLTTQLSA